MGNSLAREEIQRPPIIDVISQYVDLRKIGHEFWAVCPFHAEKTPSFAVNVEKDVFYCHGCHAGGDCISFIERIERIDFKTAARRLGLETYRPSPARLRIKTEAQRIASWANFQTIEANKLLRELGQRSSIAHELAWSKEVNRLLREWEILETLADDLQNEAAVLDLWQQSEAIENILADAPEDDRLPEFPPVTEEYRARLASYVEGYVG